MSEEGKGERSLVYPSINEKMKKSIRKTNEIEKVASHRSEPLLDGSELIPASSEPVPTSSEVLLVSSEL